MKLILLALLLTTVACNKEEVIKAANQVTETPTPTPTPEPEPEVSITDQITERLQGSYSKCVPSPTFGGYFNRMTVNVTEKTYEFWFELSAAANCSSPYYRFTHTYEIEEASYPIDGDEETIDVTFNNVSLKVAYFNAWYVGNNYCGLGWVLNVEKDMTGVACTAVAPGDTHHAKFRIAGDLEFHRLVLTDSSLTVPFGYTQSGDAATDRKVSFPTALDKL